MNISKWIEKYFNEIFVESFNSYVVFVCLWMNKGNNNCVLE